MILLLLFLTLSFSSRTVLLVEVENANVKEIQDAVSASCAAIDPSALISVYQHDCWLLTWIAPSERSTIDLAIRGIVNMNNSDWNIGLGSIGRNSGDADHIYIITNREHEITLVDDLKTIESRVKIIPILVNPQGETRVKLGKFTSYYQVATLAHVPNVFKSQMSEILVTPSPVTPSPTLAPSVALVDLTGHVYLKDNSIGQIRQKISVARGYSGIPVALIESSGKKHESISNTMGEIKFKQVGLGTVQMKVNIPPGLVSTNTLLSEIVVEKGGKLPPIELMFSTAHMDAVKDSSGVTALDITVIVMVSVLSVIILAIFIWYLVRKCQTSLKGPEIDPILNRTETRVPIIYHGLKKKE